MRVPSKKSQQTREVEPVVYVIDDDAGVRAALGRLFRSVGLHAEFFASANELRGHDLPSVPSCLVLDVRLPGATGFELHAELTKAVSIFLLFSLPRTAMFLCPCGP